MPTDNYLDDAAYIRLVAIIAEIEDDPFRKGEKADQIKEALGEIGGLWPASVRPDTLKMSQLIDFASDLKEPTEAY